MIYFSINSVGTATYESENRKILLLNYQGGHEKIR